MKHNNTSAGTEVSTPEGLHRIGDYTICIDGLQSHYRRRVPDDQIEIAKSFLTQCRRTRWARATVSPFSHDLKHSIERWAGQYISNGAVLIAALRLGITFVPYDGERSALIGVEYDSVAEVMAARGWFVAADHVTPSRIKPPAPPSPDPTEQQWRAVHSEVAKQMGLSLDEFHELVGKLFQENRAQENSNDVRF